MDVPEQETSPDDTENSPSTQTSKSLRHDRNYLWFSCRSNLELVRDPAGEHHAVKCDESGRVEQPSASNRAGVLRGCDVKSPPASNKAENIAGQSMRRGRRADSSRRSISARRRSGRRSDCTSFALHRAVVSAVLFVVRERYSLTTTRVPIDALPPSSAVGDGASIGSVDRQLAAIRKYAPSKSQSSQSMSRDGVYIGEVNALMRRWKPCPKAVG